MVYGSPGEAMGKRRFPWRALAAISLIVAVLSGIFFSTIWARWGPAETDIAGSSPALSAALVISIVTCCVSTVTSFSSLALSWRADRRQARETDLKIAQLELQLEEARAKRPLN